MKQTKFLSDFYKQNTLEQIDKKQIQLKKQYYLTSKLLVISYIDISMGNLLLQSIIKKFNVYHSYSAWQQWQIFNHQKQYTLSKLVKNIKNPSLIGELHTSKQVYKLENSLKISQFRFNFTESQIVGVHGIYSPFSHQNYQINFCGKIQNFSIVTQHMIYCLSDLGQISFKNAVFILKNSLNGAKLIKQNLNILTLYDQNMIFFDGKNRCKVWINSDISVNMVRYEDISEQMCINSIFSAIQQKVQYCINFQNYLKFKNFKQIQTFQYALQFLNQFESEQIIFKNNHGSNDCSSHNFNSHKYFEYDNIVTSQSYNEKTSQNSRLKDKNLNKKSLSVKKIKKQTQNYIFFSARKSSSQDSLNNIVTNNINFSGQLNFRKKMINQNKTNNINRKLFVNQQEKNAMLSGQICFRNKQMKNKKSSQLRKQIMKKDSIRQKFIESRNKMNQMYSKPSSNLSTQYQSIQIQSDNLSQINEGNKLLINGENKLLKNGENKQIINKQISFSKKKMQKLNFNSYDKDIIIKIYNNQKYNLQKHNKQQQKIQNKSNTFLYQQFCNVNKIKNKNIYSDRRQWISNKLNNNKNNISDNNIPQLNKYNNKVSLSNCTSRLKKQLSLPNFQQLKPLLST